MVQIPYSTERISR